MLEAASERSWRTEVPKDGKGDYMKVKSSDDRPGK